MSTFASTLKLISVCSFVIVASIGCGGTPAESPADPPPAAPSPEDKTTSVAPSNQKNAVSPAKELASQTVELNFDQTPSGVCRRFMELLHANKSIAAENLLTRVSQMNTTKEQLELKAIGGPDATFSIGEVRFATNKQKLAQVDCSVTDSSETDPFTMEITWLVRRQKNCWRISGVSLIVDEGDSPDLLSFENIHDVRRIKAINDEEILAVDPTATPEVTRQAKKPGEATDMK
jgi:hypothetical protein